MRLIDEYNSAASKFSRIVGILQAKMGVIAKEEYERIQQFTEKARARSVLARFALEQHLAEHGC